jgi:hypothetical protein
LDLEGLWNQTLQLSGDYVVRYGAAINDILTARGRLLDVLELIEQCWPQRKSWCKRRRRSSLSVKILGGTWFWLLRSQKLQHELLFDDFSQLMDGSISAHEDDENSIPELEILSAYRDAKARFAALRELNANAFNEEHIDSLAYEAAKNIDHVKRVHSSGWPKNTFSMTAFICGTKVD